MSDPGQPSGGDDVQSALHTIIDSYGVSALSNEGALSNLLSDLLADNPREAGLLLLAAKADVAGGLAQRVQQGMDPATAVRMTASAMAESSPAAPEACTWVTTEVARALGHPVPTAGSLAPSSQPTVAAPGDPFGGVATNAPTVASPPAGGVTTPGSWSPPSGAEPGAAWGQPGGAWGPEPSNPPSGPWGAPSGPPPSNPPSGPWSPQPTSAPPQPGFGGPPLSGQPPGGPPPPKKGGRGKVFAAIGAVVGVVIVYVIVAAAAKIAPFSSSSPTTSTTPPTTPAPTPTGPSTGVAQATLAQLMPFNNQVDQAGYDVSTCNNNFPYQNLQLKGMTDNLTCDQLPGYTGWIIYGYKFDTDADYTAGLAAYNQASSYDPQTAAGNDCPPPSLNAKGISPYHTSAYPSRSGNSQVIECLATLNRQNQQLATYIYTLPTQRAFFEVDAAPGVSFATLDQWWDLHGGPGTAPSS